MYEHGEGVEQDIKKALNYYQTAVDSRKCSEASTPIAEVYFQGKYGIPQDMKKGFEIFQTHTMVKENTFRLAEVSI